MPLFVASSSMVMQTPYHEPSTTACPPLKEVEATIDSIVKKRTENLEKRCDQSIAKSEQGNKKLDDIIRRLVAIERNSNDQPYFPQAQRNIHFPQRPNGSSNAQSNQLNSVQEEPRREENGILSATEILNTTTGEINTNPSPTQENDPTRMWNPVNLTSARETTNQASAGSWAQVVAENLPTQPAANPSLNNARDQRMSWRQRLHLLQGVSGDSGNTGALSADVDIVAYNVAKNVTFIYLRNWLAQKGLSIKGCKSLTTFLTK